MYNWIIQYYNVHVMIEIVTKKSLGNWFPCFLTLQNICRINLSHISEFTTDNHQLSLLNFTRNFEVCVTKE